MELTHEQLDETCRRCGITAFLCEQGYNATLEDVLSDHPEYDRDSTEAKTAAIDIMLMSSLDFGPYADVDDLDEDEESARMEERDRVLEAVVPKLVNGEYSGQAMNELELAQAECVRMTMPDKVGKYTGADILEEIEHRQWVPGKDYDYSCLLTFLSEEGEDSSKLLDDKLDEYENLDGSY
jgi:hypothetical protein